MTAAHDSPAFLRRGMDIDDYMIGSTIISVFLWQTLYEGSFNFLLGYVVILFNSFLLLTRSGLEVHRNHALFLLGLAFVSILAATLTHNAPSAMVSQLVGISIFSIYHYSVLAQRRISLTRIMEMYCTVTVIVAATGFIPYLLGGGAHKLDQEYRYTSWFPEPSNYIYTSMPALSYLMLRWQREGVRSYSAILLLFTYLLADSSLGYTGIAVTLMLMAGARSVRNIVLALILVSLAVYSAYTFSENVRVRTNETIGILAKTETKDVATSVGPDTQALEGTNSTTLALLSNGYVAYQAFIRSPVIGNGLGTHQFSYEKYAPDVISKDFYLWGLNEFDANSLILRLASETGIVGILTLFWLIYYFGRVRSKRQIILRNAIIPYLVVRVTRFGAYFSMEVFFFAMIYAFNHLEGRPGWAGPQDVDATDG